MSIGHCNEDAQILCNFIESCIIQFQNNHGMCHEASSSRQPGFMIEVRINSDQAAVAMLENFIRSLVVCKHAKDYVNGHDSFYVESFNNVCLIYLDKWIHYRNTMYEVSNAQSQSIEET
jgi:hypothetical protein